MSGTVPDTAPQKGNVSTPAAVTGTASAAGIVLVWGLQQFKIEVPPEVALAILALVSPVIHWAVVKLNPPYPGEKP